MTKVVRLIWILQIIAIIGIGIVAACDVMNGGTVSQRTAEGAGVGLTVVWALTIILNFCALSLLSEEKVIFVREVISLSKWIF